MRDFDRISSTQLKDFLRCPRLWAFINLSGHENAVGYAAACGTVVHAILEHRLQNENEYPTREQVEAMPGNYEDPAVALEKWQHKGIWEEAVETAQAVGDPWDFIPSEYAQVCCELDMETWRITEQGVRCGGYIDVYAIDEENGRALLFDWKTRGKQSWKYRPQGEALASDTQLLYYATVLRRRFPAVSAVEVAHGNILRAGEGKPVVEVQRATILAPQMDAFWADLTEKHLPAMHAVHTLWGSKARRAELPAAEQSACFAYGRCSQMTRCNALDSNSTAQGSIIDQMLRANAEAGF